MLDLDSPPLDWVSIAHGLGIEAAVATSCETFVKSLARPAIAFSLRGTDISKCGHLPSSKEATSQSLISQSNRFRRRD